MATGERVLFLFLPFRLFFFELPIAAELYNAYIFLLQISAQSSRRRKKDYVDDMEARAINSETENKELKRKVATLESQNKILMNQLKRMQSLIVRKNPGQKSATALMVLLLSTALFMVPGFKEYQSEFDLFT